MIEKVVKYFKENNVKCKKVEDGRGDFIAIMGYGDLSRNEIVKQVTDNNLLCMFFEGTIRKDEYNKRMAIKN